MRLFLSKSTSLLGSFATGFATGAPVIGLMALLEFQLRKNASAQKPNLILLSDSSAIILASGVSKTK